MFPNCHPGQASVPCRVRQACGSIMIFPCPNMFRMSAKVVLCNSVTFDMSSSFLTHDTFVLVANSLVSSQLDYCKSLFSSLSKLSLSKLLCIQNSASIIVSITSIYTSVIPLLRKLHIGFLLNMAQFSKQPHLFSSFFTLVFQSILLQISLKKYNRP